MIWPEEPPHPAEDLRLNDPKKKFRVTIDLETSAVDTTQMVVAWLMDMIRENIDPEDKLLAVGVVEIQ